MMRVYLLIALAMLTTCASVLGQSAASADSTTSTDSSERQPPSVPTMLVSGFVVPSKGGYSPAFAYDGLLARVRSKWYPQVSELVKSAAMKGGTTTVEFAIRRDGSLAKIKMIESSGSGTQDNAAKQAIASSVPFTPLPDNYLEKTLRLRMYFGYDHPASPEAPTCTGPDSGAHPAEGTVVYQVGNGVKIPRSTYAPDPEYSEEARKGKYRSDVTLAGTVDPQGQFTDLCIVQAAGFGLDEQAIRAVRTWKFDPATREGQAVAVRIKVEVSFRLY